MRGPELSSSRVRGTDRGYIAYHAPRYVFLVQLLTKLELSVCPRVLDIGPSKLTGLIRDASRVKVDTLGFGSDEIGETGRHFEFDLNSTQNAGSWRRDLP